MDGSQGPPQEPNTVDFTLRSVLCVVDLLRAASLLDEHRERGAETAGAMTRET